MLERLKMHQHRDSTDANYYTVWKLFNQFFIRLDSKPTRWEDRLALFVTHHINEGTQSQTILSYISAIRSVLKAENVELGDDTLRLGALVRACKIKNDVVSVRLPILIKLRDMILDKIEDYYLSKGQVYLAALYRALISTGYFGLLRVGELTAGSHPIMAYDVMTGRSKRKIQLVLRTSKTHGKAQLPQIVTIVSTEEEYSKHKYCPHRIINEFIKVRPKYKTEKEPFFIFIDKTPVKPYHLRTVLRNAIKAIGLDPMLYDTHSLSVGRATVLFKRGFHIDKRKFLGRWRINAVYSYLREYSVDC